MKPLSCYIGRHDWFSLREPVIQVEYPSLFFDKGDNFSLVLETCRQCHKAGFKMNHAESKGRGDLGTFEIGVRFPRTVATIEFTVD